MSDNSGIAKKFGECGLCVM